MTFRRVRVSFRFVGFRGSGLVLGAVAIILATAALHLQGVVGVGLGIGSALALLVAWAVWPLRELARD